MQRGFIQIPFLIAIIVTVVFGSGVYVAYEVIKPSQNTSDSAIAIIAADVQVAKDENLALPTASSTISELEPTTSPSTLDQLVISLIGSGKEEIINNAYALPLPSGNILYFGIPNDVSWGAAPFCGSGGCEYDFYVGSDPVHVKKVSGFDSYYLDCDTNEISLFHDGRSFGFPKLDVENHILRMYYHLNADLGTENIYHIADGGSPELIASYDHTCSDKVQTLFISSKYSAQLTTF